MSSTDAGPIPATAGFPIIGVGASAGGLVATTDLLQALGATPGIALVVVHHLDPTHESKLAEILAKATKMPVVVAQEGARVEVDHVHVIPHGADVTVTGGLLHLTPRDEQRGPHLPVDRLFESLAEDQDSLAVGVVLSGTGFDGAAGVRAIHAAGGLTFAQDATAQYPDMPCNAVATGCVGFVLSPAAIARELTRLGERMVTAPAQGKRELAIITGLLQRASGTDFSYYKPATLLRRIERRSFLSHRASLQDYVELLRQSPAELLQLCEDVLIHVTDFFRDPSVFDALAQDVFPRLLENHPPDLPIRVWVPACSSGEEVYSLAITLDEVVRAVGAPVLVKLFGTDVSTSVLEKARAARYPESIERHISPERLERYFVRVAGGYQITRTIREMCVFARHDVIRDPPFSHIDLISCRNLMIYLGATTQDRIMPLFHYALREPGFLVLGSSETVRNFAGFDAFDPKHRIFARSSAAPRTSVLFNDRRQPGQAAAPGFMAPPGPSELQREVDRVLLGRFAPPGLVVTENLAVVHFRGQTGAFLEPASGAATLDLMRLVREDLRLSLRQVIDAARVRGGPADARCLTDGGRRAVTIEVLPLMAPATQQRHFIVLFVAEATPPTTEPAATPPQAGAERLTDELESTRRYLESVIEQLEASNEELKAANEEIVSSNEELRSINEELQTAKEELTATNEELCTTNDEMNARNKQISLLNDDLVNVLNSVEFPIVLLDGAMRVRRFTSAAAAVFRLLPGDVGRPFADIKSLLRSPDLALLAAKVFADLTASSVSGQDDQGRWYRARLNPYVTADKRIDGVILCIVDIDELKKASERLEEARVYAENIVDGVREGLVVLDSDMRVRSTNRTFRETLAVTPADTLGRRIAEIGHGVLDVPELHGVLARLGHEASAEGTLVLPCSSGPRTFALHALRMEQHSLTLLALADVTAQQLAQESVRRSERQLRAVLAAAATAILMADREGKIVFANDAAARIFGFTESELLARCVEDLVPDPSRAALAQLRAEYFERATSQSMGAGRELVGRRKDGGQFPVEVTLGAVNDADQPRVVAFIEDMTERRRSEAMIHDYQARLQAMAFDAAVVEEKERRQIAMDIHDRIAQSLALAQMKLSDASPRLTGDSRAEVDAAMGLIEQCSADARSLMFDLSPPVLYDLGLAAALSWLAEDFEKRHGVHVELSAEPSTRSLDDTTAALLFRAVRELLINVVKHARTPSAKVTLTWQDAHIDLAVQDAGVGFQPPEPGVPGPGFGLFSVREQVDRLGGVLQVDSAPGTGTRILIRVPVQQTPPAAGAAV